MDTLVNEDGAAKARLLVRSEGRDVVYSLLYAQALVAGMIWNKDFYGDIGDGSSLLAIAAIREIDDLVAQSVGRESDVTAFCDGDGSGCLLPVRRKAERAGCQNCEQYCFHCRWVLLIRFVKFWIYFRGQIVS